MGDATRQHQEIEIKLDAPAGFALPGLGELPGVATVAEAGIEELDAVYLDSDDLRLIRGGTTLRRRTGGGDAGWHLKLPVAKHERLEVRRAPGRSEKAVPAALRGLVTLQLRGADLAPVARISTRRAVHRLLDADGVVLAEIADDAVTTQLLGDPADTGPAEAGEPVAGEAWREIEVELVAGDRRLLKATRAALIAGGAAPAASDSKLQRVLGVRLAESDGALHAGAGGAARAGSNGAVKRRGRAAPRAGEVVVRYLGDQVAALLAQDPRVRLDAEEGVHAMRVATRRLRAATAAYRPVFAEGAVEPLRAELAWLGSELGAVRDLDVLRARLRREVAEQPREVVLGPVMRRIDQELRARRKEARERLLEALNGARYLALVEALEGFVAEPPFADRADAPAEKELRRRVRATCRRVRREQRRLDGVPAGADRDLQLHRVRVAAKRARYAAEVARPVHGKPAKRLVAALTAVQDALGEHQDVVVERDVLRDLAVRTFLAGENSFTLGRLHGLTEARAVRAEEVFAQEWEAARGRIADWPG